MGATLGSMADKPVVDQAAGDYLEVQSGGAQGGGGGDEYIDVSPGGLDANPEGISDNDDLRAGITPRVNSADGGYLEVDAVP